MTRISAPEDFGTLWLLTLQRAIGRASHDVKDALNGVSVNLEVIRSRADRPEAPATSVAPFGHAAGQQLDRLTILVEAVLTLARADRSPADVGATLRRVVALCGAAASAADASVELVDTLAIGSSQTSVHGDIVRLALMSPLLDVVTAIDRSHRLSGVTCTLGGDDEVVEVVIAAGGRAVPMSEGVAEVLRGAGVRLSEGKDLSLAFPRA